MRRTYRITDGREACEVAQELQYALSNAETPPDGGPAVASVSRDKANASKRLHGGIRTIQADAVDGGGIVRVISERSDSWR